jgi:hypothetical protein
VPVGSSEFIWVNLQGIKADRYLSLYLINAKDFFSESCAF